MSKYHLEPASDGFRKFDWSDVKTFPESYELVLLALENGKCVAGWHDGYRRWTGLRLRKSDKVVAYKRNHGLY